MLRSALLMLAFLSAATGCSVTNDASAAPSDAFADQQSAAEAKTQLSRWITPNAMMANAVQKLGAHGFSCRAAEPASAEARAATLCVYAMPPPKSPSERVTAPATPVNWFVTLTSLDGSTVSDFQVARSPNALGE
jgi:hypothetical protein